MTGRWSAAYAAWVQKSTPLYRLIFVCTGNTCRSPLAAVALRRALGKDGSRVGIDSAGIAATPDNPATRLAVDVAQASGLELHGHRTTRLERTTVADVDVILVMSRHELEAVKRIAPEAASRTSLVTDFALDEPRGVGIPDPFGGSREAYEECLHRIEEQVARMAPYILKEVRSRQQEETTS